MKHSISMSGVCKRLILDLYRSGGLKDWKPRQTVMANRRGLIEVRRGRLVLTADGVRVAKTLERDGE